MTQANVKVLGDAPAIAVGNLYQATSQAISNVAHGRWRAGRESPILPLTDLGRMTYAP